MDQPILTNEHEYPAEEIIFSHIGKSKMLWQSVFEFIHATYPDLSAEWKYYNDGKSWLLKVTKKSKTICWVSLLKNSFRMTFYFTDKAEHLILDSTISDKLKEQFKNGKHYNKIRGVTITFKYKKDVEYAKMLIVLKLSLK